MEFWVLLVIAVAYAALALVILTRASRASSVSYFGVSALFIAVWSIGALLMLYGDTERLVYVGLLLFLIAPMISSLAMVLFSKYFSGVNFPGKYTAIAAYGGLLVAFAVVTLAAIQDSAFIVAIHGFSGNDLNFQHAWLLTYGVFGVISVAISLAYLAVGVARSKGRARKRRRRMLLGVLAAGIPAVLTTIILPYFGNTDFIWLGLVASMFYGVTACYVMVKGGLFDIRQALVLTFTYGLSLLVLATMYYFIAVVVSAFTGERQSAQLFSGVDIAVALLLVFLFQPIRRFFDKLTTNIFYQNSYSADEFYAQLSGTLASTNDLHVLLGKASEKISQTLKSTDVSFVIYNEHERVEQIGTGRYGRISLKEVQWLDRYLGPTHTDSKVLSMLDDGEEELRRLMVSHRMAIILPLVHQDSKMGYLILGEHRRSSYDARDLRVMRTLANEMVVAIQNALSVEEIRKLNAQLEQKIDAATKELRRSNAQLQKLDEAKDEFISMASHQLRTPLTSIKGYLSMLIEGDVGEVSKEQKRFLSEAFVSSERMVRLIGDFLNVSRLQTGKFVIEKRPIDLARLVQREIDSLESNAQARDIRLMYKKPKNIPELMLDENKIQQVVMNFADNAIFYSKEKSKVTIQLKKVPGFVEFTVTDTGIGVPETEQANLFNKFFRASNARRVRPDGTGVGLFLAKKVITDHHGTMIFESKEGKGSTFGFQLPISKK